MTRRLSFPKLVLNRLPAAEQVVMPKDADYKNLTTPKKQRFEATLKTIQDDLPKNVFAHYDPADYAYAQQVYTGWNSLQRNLALLALKPQALERIYDDYQKLVALADDDSKAITPITTIKIEISDFIFDTFDNDCGYLSIKIELLNLLPYAIRLPMWQLLTTGFLPFSSEYGMHSFTECVHDLLLDYPEQGFDIAITLLPLMNQNIDMLRKVVFLTQYLDSHVCVPYVIMGMNSVKTKRYINPNVFITHFPDTFYDEMVYILFTKAADNWHKKAQVHAKKLLQHMIESMTDNKEHTPDYLAALRAATHRYEVKHSAHHDTPLTDFLNHYVDNHQQITQEKQALNEAESTITLMTAKQIPTDNDGIPKSLLNTDWQKQTRKRKFELNETIWNKQTKTATSKQIPILEALTPPIIASTNKPLPSKAFEQLLLMLKLSTEDKPVFTLAEVLPAFTDESLAQLSDELWQDYMNNRVAGGYSAYFSEDNPRLYGVFNTQNKWFMTASAWMANETLAKNVWQLIKECESESYLRSSILHSFKVLSALASMYPDSKRGDTALKMLIKISNKSRSTLRPHAQSALQGYAERLNVSLEDLAERLLPDFGLDARGTKILDYNPSVTDSRKLTVALTPELTFTYQDARGKSYKTLPKACATDDVDAVSEFLNQHKDEKKELRAISSDLPKSLEKMMIHQRALSLADFMRYYVHHPVMTVLTQKLLWQIQVADDANKSADDKQTLRVSESLELLDSADIALKDELLTDNMLISLVHPLKLSATELQEWAEVFSDYELSQPFSQLSRPLYYLTDQERTSGAVHRFDDVRFAMGSLIGLKSAHKGWDVFSHGGGHCDGFTKTVNGHHLQIALIERFGMWESVSSADQGHRIESIKLPKDIDELSASELLHDINEMARVS